MEQLDRQKRDTNVVLFGVPDEQIALDGATTEDDKIQKVWNAVEAVPSTVIRSHRRLRHLSQGGRTPRPLLVRLVRLDSKAIRDQILDKAARLKNMQEPFKNIYIKKDSHTEVRKE